MFACYMCSSLEPRIPPLCINYMNVRNLRGYDEEIENIANILSTYIQVKLITVCSTISFDS
jgi:hypothetical protein